MLSLKPATPQDLTSIQELAREIWTKHYVPIVGREQVDYMLNKFYLSPALEKQISEGQKFHLILDGDRPIGFISVSNKGEQDYFLHKFYIRQEQQNSGKGTEVFQKIFGELYQPESIRLTVNRQNFRSINFYFKLGFKIERVEDFDIGNGYFMNDFVMTWKKN
jgi:ribosomal protein S18 acetylase RimI-like enzyme